MATDPARAARQPAGCADDLKSNLLALVHRHTRAIIDAELHRLARRAPSLSPADLDVINTVLEELADIFGAGINTDDMRTEIDGSRRVVMMTPAARRHRDDP